MVPLSINQMTDESIRGIGGITDRGKLKTGKKFCPTTNLFTKISHSLLWKRIGVPVV
jgi:hypothetical protein